MTSTFTFDEAQLHIPGEHGKPPLPMQVFFTGRAEVDGRGEITAIWIDHDRPKGRADSLPWPVPLGHELHRMLAASLRITHADDIRECVDDIWTDRRPVRTWPYNVYVG